MTFSPGKADGSECFAWDCTESAPPHGVTWRCANGHRETYWYCTGHITRMTELAISTLNGPVQLLCRTCSWIRLPVLEGIGA